MGTIQRRAAVLGWLAAMLCEGCVAALSAGPMFHSAGPAVIEAAADLGIAIRHHGTSRVELISAFGYGRNPSGPGASYRLGFEGGYFHLPEAGRYGPTQWGWMLGTGLDIVWFGDFAAQVSELLYAGPTVSWELTDGRRLGLAAEGFIGASQSPDHSTPGTPLLPNGALGGVRLRVTFDLTASADSGSGGSSHGAGLLARSPHTAHNAD